MFKTGLNIAHFKQHVEIIEEETKEYFSRWGDSGEQSKMTEPLELVRVSTVFHVESNPNAQFQIDP